MAFTVSPENDKRPLVAACIGFTEPMNIPSESGRRGEPSRMGRRYALSEVAMNRILLACAVLLVASGCSKAPPVNVMDTDNGPQPIAKTTRCTVPNADGVRCDVKTCKADAQSDCSTFEIGCTTYNHTYTGDKDSGTCTRGPIVGRNVRDRDRLAFAP